MFDEKGQIIIDKEECDMDADDLMMQALDAGAEDLLMRMTATKSQLHLLILMQSGLLLRRQASQWLQQRSQ